MTNTSSHTASKGKVVLGLHNPRDLELTTYFIIRSGYEPIPFPDADGIIGLIEGTTLAHAFVMDLNLEPNPAKRMPEDFTPGRRVTEAMKLKGYNVYASFMGVSGNPCLIDKAREFLIPAFPKITSLDKEKLRIADFLDKRGIFALEEIPQDPPQIKKYLEAITTGKHYKP